jgi:hypothetical protein
MYTSTGVYVARFPHTYLLLLVPTFTGNLNLTSNIHLNRQENYTHESAKYSLLLSCRDLTGRRDWDTLHLLRGSNGDVPWWMPSLPNHDDRSLSSDAFLRYIRKQVEEFNHEVSQKMLTHMFHRNIPDYSSPTVSHLD